MKLDQSSLPGKSPTDELDGNAMPGPSRRSLKCLKKRRRPLWGRRVEQGGFTSGRRRIPKDPISGGEPEISGRRTLPAAGAPTEFRGAAMQRFRMIK